MRRKIALAVLIVLGIAVAMGATTDRRLTGDYFNANYHANASVGEDKVWHMNKNAKGATNDVTLRKMPRWWSFSASADVTIRIWTPATPGWNGDFADTSTAGNWVAIAIKPGQTWNSEGLPIYAYLITPSGSSSLMVIARD